MKILELLTTNCSNLHYQNITLTTEFDLHIHENNSISHFLIITQCVISYLLFNHNNDIVMPRLLPFMADDYLFWIKSINLKVIVFYDLFVFSH